MYGIYVCLHGIYVHSFKYYRFGLTNQQECDQAFLVLRPILLSWMQHGGTKATKTHEALGAGLDRLALS